MSIFVSLFKFSVVNDIQKLPTIIINGDFFIVHPMKRNKNRLRKFQLLLER